MLRKNIIWIVSYPKSGNTWFRLFLSSVFNPERNSIDINQIDSTALIASNRGVFDKLSGTNSSDLTKQEIYTIRPQVYKSISSEANETIYIKVHDAWQKNKDGIELFPSEITKGVILIVRNPFDIAISLTNHSGISIEKAINRLNDKDHCLDETQSRLPSQLYQYIGSWSEHFRTWVDHSGLNVLVVKYEDMLINPIPTFSRALEFLEIDIDIDQIRSSINKCSFENLQAQEKSVGFREKPIKSNLFFNVGKKDYWKDFLDDDAKNQIINFHSEILERLNY